MDSEKVISLVRAHPVLYNTGHPDYRRTKMKDELWDKIGQELGTDGAVVKDKWGKLRDCHREAMRRQKKKSGQKADPPKPWIFQKEMEFLIPLMKKRPTTSNVEPPSTETADADESEATGIESDAPSDQVAETSDTDNDETENTYQTPKSINIQKRKLFSHTEDEDFSKKKVKPSAIEQFLGKCEQRAKQREVSQKLMLESRAEQKDALQQFFEAMYSITKELPVTYQRKIRNQIFEIVSRTEEQYEYERSRNISNEQTTQPTSSAFHPLTQE